MSLYTTLARLNDRYTEYMVRQAFSGKGDENSPDPDDDMVDPTIQRSMDTMHEYLGVAYTVPFAEPFPNQIVNLCEEGTILLARRDKNGGQLSDSWEKEYEKWIQKLKDFGAGVAKIDGLELTDASGIKTNNDDGREPQWRSFHTNEQGEVVEDTTTFSSTLDRIL